MNYGLDDDYFILKLAISLLLMSLIIVTGSSFSKLYKGQLLKKKNKNIIAEINSLLNNLLKENEEKTSKKVLTDIKTLFLNNQHFRELLIIELKKRLDEDENRREYIELYNLVGGITITQRKLISKNPILVYQGLQELDRFNVFSEKESLIRLRRHSDIRVSILATCILFRHLDYIKAADILNLESIICPMVEIRIFNEFRRCSKSPQEKEYMIEVLNECLQFDTSEKMKSFLNKSLMNIAV